MVLKCNYVALWIRIKWELSFLLLFPEHFASTGSLVHLFLSYSFEFHLCWMVIYYGWTDRGCSFKAVSTQISNCFFFSKQWFLSNQKVFVDDVISKLGDNFNLRRFFRNVHQELLTFRLEAMPSRKPNKWQCYLWKGRNPA